MPIRKVLADVTIRAWDIHFVMNHQKQEGVPRKLNSLCVLPIGLLIITWQGIKVLSMSVDGAVIENFSLTQVPLYLKYLPFGNHYLQENRYNI